MAKCTVCGRGTGENGDFCHHCGARMSAEDSAMGSETIRDMAHEYAAMVLDHPDDANARYMLGLARMYDRQWGSAAEQFREVVDLEAEFADAHVNLAVCLARLGQKEQALAAIDQALSLSPGSPRYERIRERIVRLATGP